MATTLDHNPVAPSPVSPSGRSRRDSKKAIWDWKIVHRALIDAFLKLNPRKMMGNPVMFVVEVGSVITTALLFKGGSAFFVQPADHTLAVVHGAVCELRRSDGRRSRQGPG